METLYYDDAYICFARSRKRLLAVLVPDVRVLDVHVEPERFVLTVTPASSTAACPRCTTSSSRVHSYYIRRPGDLSITGRASRLLLHARRFRCINPACPTATSSERLPNLVVPAAQRTLRLNAALRDLALAFGGQAGARHSVRAVIPASGDTLCWAISARPWSGSSIACGHSSI
jgi:transposase